MKLLFQKFVKDGAGEVKIVPEHVEDLWHSYNLVREGDIITATTFRKVIRDRGNSADAERVKLKLTLEVDGVDFDPEGEEIRVSGKNLTESEHIKLGAHHTITLDLQRAFQLHKREWDVVDIDRLKSACDPVQSADLAVILMTDGLANLVLVGGNCTTVRAKVEQSLPRKHGAAAAGYDKAVQKFNASCLQAVIKHVDFNIVKCLVIAGPGFAKEQFKTYMEAEAVRQGIRPLIENSANVVLAPASSAYKQSLKEVLEAPGISDRIKDTMASKEVRALAEFHAMLSNDSARAFYGPGHVAAAAELGAVQKLLITDSVFRVNNVEKRRKVTKLVEGIREAAGEVIVFSAMHVSGQQLAKLTGVAAILRFPLEDLEDQELEAPW
eukprot:CAMPEP_0117663006 /NCGR_PEP_ID=MMETSP0804-20121206/8353_1 /TAXON_ID=1074897 /ORGANISM="Tetraselmis astigmatica, Strain CCMP880" /LENGTH=381 /DNA_ID=CAMNT_0005469937 /DNA_START=585 /DNA_END=1730 /DNA_ORIENTATION=-